MGRDNDSVYVRFYLKKKFRTIRTRPYLNERCSKTAASQWLIRNV